MSDTAWVALAVFLVIYPWAAGRVCRAKGVSEWPPEGHKRGCCCETCYAVIDARAAGLLWPLWLLYRPLKSLYRLGAGITSGTDNL